MSVIHLSVSITADISLIIAPIGPFSDFLQDDGSRRMMELAQELEDVFPSYDLSGQRITSIHSHYRMLTTNCPSKFEDPCNGTCNSCGSIKATALCKARKLRCKASSVKGEVIIMQ